MTKKELVKAAAEAAGVTQSDASAVIDSVVNTIMRTVANGEDVVLTGFGTFHKRNIPARSGINPRTREPVEYPAKSAPAFKAGKSFKEKVAE